MSNITPLFPREDRFTNRITATNYSHGPQEAPMAIDVPHVEDEPQWMRSDIDNLSGGVICLLLVGCFVSMCLAVAVMG